MQSTTRVHRAGILQQQALFSVYVHTPPDYKPYGAESLFHGAEIKERIKAAWGGFDLAQVRSLVILKHPSLPLFILLMYLCHAVVAIYRSSQT